MIKLPIMLNGTRIVSTWNNSQELYKYCTPQRGRGLPLFVGLRALPQLRINWQTTCDMLVQAGLLDGLPTAPRILDVGSGVGVLSVILAQYIHNSEFWLVDRELLEPQRSLRSWDNTHGFYNSWNPIKDAIEANSFDPARFNLLDVQDPWPTDMDLLISTYSWCWHYPKSVYWNRVQSTLKKKGRLILTVSNWPELNMAEEITEQLRCEPTRVAIPMTTHISPGSWHVDSQGNRGYMYSWINT